MSSLWAGSPATKQQISQPIVLGTGAKDRVLTECECCGNQYKRRAPRSDETRFCSRSCKDAWKRTKATKTTTCSCSHCGSTIEKKPHLAKQHDHHFCHDNCRGQWMSEHQRRDANPNSKGGVTHEFGENWTKQRERVLQRGEVCQNCGSDGSGTHLDVHHIVPRSEFDVVEHANSALSLVVLCRSCHKKAEHGTISCPHPEIIYENRTYVDAKFVPHNQRLPTSPEYCIQII